MWSVTASWSRWTRNEVAVGDVIVVKPGEQVPLDGVVLEGSSAAEYRRPHRASPCPGRWAAGDERHQRLRQPERPLAGAGDQGLRRVHRGQNSGPGGERQQQEGQGGELHHQICPVLHPCRGHRRGGCWRCCRPCSSGRRWSGVDPAGPDLPGGLLPLRPGHLRAPQLLRRHRRGLPARASWSRAATIWRRWPQTEVVVFDKTGTLTQGVFNVTAIHPDQYCRGRAAGAGRPGGELLRPPHLPLLAARPTAKSMDTSPGGGGGGARRPRRAGPGGRRNWCAPATTS